MDKATGGGATRLRRLWEALSKDLVPGSRHEPGLGGVGEPARPDKLMRVVYGCNTLHNEQLLERVGPTLSPPGSGLISGPVRKSFRDSMLELM